MNVPYMKTFRNELVHRDMGAWEVLRGSTSFKKNCLGTVFAETRRSYIKLKSRRSLFV